MKNAITIFTLAALALSGCSAGQASSGDGAVTAAVQENKLAIDSCISTQVIYGGWSGLAPQDSAGPAGDIAAEDFERVLLETYVQASKKYGYDELKAANQGLVEGQQEFLEIETLAGIVIFYEYLNSWNATTDERWQPGHHVSLDEMFESLVKKRCNGLPGFEQEAKRQNAFTNSSPEPSPSEEQPEQQGSFVSLDTWPPAGFELITDELAGRIPGRYADCDSDCWGISYDFVTKNGCQASLTVSADHLDADGNVYDTSSQTSGPLEPGEVVAMDLVTFVNKEGGGMRFAEVDCH